jgi:lipid A oxidase
MRSDSHAAVLVLTIACALCPATARADWILSGFLGHARTQSSTIDLTVAGQSTQLQLLDVNYRGESFRSPQYYGVRATWISEAHPWLGIEGEWIHAKVYAEADRDVHVRGTLRGVPIDAVMPLSSIAQRLSMSHGLNFILANVAARRGFGPANADGSRRLIGVVRAGVGPTMPHAESQLDNTYFEQYEGGGIGAQVGAGFEVALWGPIGALGEYKFTWASPEIDVAGGQAKIPSRSHHFVFGLIYDF